MENKTVIKVEKLSKVYKLGQIGGATLSDEIKEKWARITNKPNPNAPILNHYDSKDGMVYAIQDITFEVKQGDIMGIIGKNGAGKSTLLKILSSITKPTSGKAYFSGRIGSMLEVGTGFHPELTGMENIYLNGAILGMTKDEIKTQIEEIIDFSGISLYIDTPIKRYSSGMVVRLAFAVAAHLDPEILLIDEVLAVGDIDFQNKCIKKMKDISESGRTILFVSHNLGVIKNFCDKCIWIDNGKLRKIGITNNVVDEYINHASKGILNTTDKINLNEFKRAGDLGESIKILSLCLNEGKNIKHDETFTCEIVFDVYQSINEISFGIGFNSVDGVRIMTVDSDNQNERYNFKPKRNLIIKLVIDKLELTPTKYLVDIGIRSGDKTGVDLISNFLIVDVLPSKTTPPMFFIDNGGNRPKGNWEVNNND